MLQFSEFLYNILSLMMKNTVYNRTMLFFKIRNKVETV